MDVKKLKMHLKNVSEALDFFNQILDQESAISEERHDEKKELIEYNDLKRLLKQEIWPQAIENELICLEEHEDDKLARAAEVCKDVFKTDLTNKKILDFGCGEGHSSYLLATLSDAEIVVGYDIEQNFKDFEQVENLLFSNDLQQVYDQNSYDIILAYDVLDHTDDIEKTMQLLKSLKKETGKIYLRCHPWTSRHATHIYKDLNKAYAHLIFSEDEFYQMGIKPGNAVWCNDPINFYKDLFRKNDLKIIQENITTQSFEFFFLTKPAILKRMKKNLKIEEKLPIDVLEIQFIDYLLI